MMPLPCRKLLWHSVMVAQLSQLHLMLWDLVALPPQRELLWDLTVAELSPQAAGQLSKLVVFQCLLALTVREEFPVVPK